MEQPPAKRHNTGYNPPPPTAEWVQTLARDHTDPQPLPRQSLTCTFKDGTKKVLEARTLELVFCRGAKCRRLACCDKVPGLAAARAAMPKGLAKDRALDELNAAKAAWRTTDCESCAEFDFKSGDVLIFDGSPAADVAHGVLDTLAGTGPAELPDWAKGCAVSLQYRQRRK